MQPIGEGVAVYVKDLAGRGPVVVVSHEHA
jgi:hypothetical protein